jgi:hypothetical protein
LRARGRCFSAELDALGRALRQARSGPLIAIVAAPKSPPSSPSWSSLPKKWISSSSAAALPTRSCLPPA